MKYYLSFAVLALVLLPSYLLAQSLSLQTTANLTGNGCVRLQNYPYAASLNVQTYNLQTFDMNLSGQTDGLVRSSYQNVAYFLAHLNANQIQSGPLNQPNSILLPTSVACQNSMVDTSQGQVQITHLNSFLTSTGVVGELFTCWNNSGTFLGVKLMDSANTIYIHEAGPC